MQQKLQSKESRRLIIISKVPMQGMTKNSQDQNATIQTLERIVLTQFSHDLRP